MSTNSIEIIVSEEIAEYERRLKILKGICEKSYQLTEAEAQDLWDFNYDKLEHFKKSKTMASKKTSPITPKTKRVRIVKPKAKKAEKGFHKQMCSVHHPEDGRCYGIVRQEPEGFFNEKNGCNEFPKHFVIYTFRRAQITSPMKGYLAVDLEMSLMESMQRVVTRCKTQKEAALLVPQLCGQPTTAL